MLKYESTLTLKELFNLFDKKTCWWKEEIKSEIVNYVIEKSEGVCADEIFENHC